VFYYIIDDIRLLVSMLPPNFPNSMITSIKYNFERKAPIKQLNDGGSKEGLVDPMKSLKKVVSKNKGGIFG